jgi:hypothetical protein
MHGVPRKNPMPEEGPVNKGGAGIKGACAGSGRRYGHDRAIEKMVQEKSPQSSYQRGEKEASMMVEITCPHCNWTKKIPREKIPLGVRRATCPRCKERFEFILTDDLDGRPTAGADSAEARRVSPPWEERSTYGTGQAVLQTVRAVLFSPVSFFRHAEVKGGLREPLAFGILVGSIAIMVDVFWQFLLSGETIPLIADSLFGSIALGFLFVGTMIFSPLFVVLLLLVWSLMAHLCLMVVRGATNGFEATFRVAAYSQAAQLWGLIPFVGGFIGGIWFLVVQIIGLREIHGISYLKVVAALLLALVLPVVLMVAVLVALATVA